MFSSEYCEMFKNTYFDMQLMFQSLLIKFSENQGVWASAVVNKKGKYFLEKPAAIPCERAAIHLIY